MKIKFVYSGVYDSMWPKPEEKLSRKFIEEYLKEIERRWKKIENKVLKAISSIAGLKWKEDEIKVYFLSGGRSFSNPLTIRYYKNKNDFIDILTHELIHQIQIQNREKIKKWYGGYIEENYQRESPKTKSHIIVQAVHWKILEEIFGIRRLNRQRKNHEKYPDYKRAWEIVEKETPEKIIKDFKRITK